MAQTKLPAFFDMVFTKSDGHLSSDGYLYNDQMFQVLNALITQNGIALPAFTTAQVGAFPSTVTAGTIWYNSDLGKLQFKNGSGVQTITSTP